MNDKDIHRLIQAQNKEENYALFEDIQTKLGISSQIEKGVKIKRKFNYKIFTLATAMVLVLCLSVVLPIALQFADDGYRFSANTTELLFEGLDCSWKEYVLSNDISALYVDFDEIDERMLERWFEPDDYGSSIFFSEAIVCYEAEYLYKYSIIPSNIIIEDIESQDYFYELSVNDVTVSCSFNQDEGFAKFEYQGYKYYFEFYDSVDEQFIRETIESMFN